MANNVLCRIDFDGSVDGGSANFDIPSWGNNLSATSMAELDKNKQLPPLFVVGGKVEENMAYGEQGQKYGIRGGVSQTQNKNYKELDAIESTGTQFINSGIPSDENLEMITSIAWTNINIFQYEGWDFGNEFWGLQLNNLYYKDVFGATIYKNTYYDIKINNLGLWLNDQLIVPEGFSVNKDYFYQLIGQFACIRKATKFIQNGIVLRNFVPCVLNNSVNENPNVLGSTNGKLGDVGMWDTITNCFFGNQGSGVFSAGNVIDNSFSLKIKGTNNALIDNITIHFDKANNQFATEYIIDGEIRTNDDAILTLKWETAATSKTIIFTKWNRSNFNAVVQYLSFELNNKEFNWSQLKSVEFTDQIRPYQAEPFFDVMSSVGTVTLRDIDGELKDWANDGILESNLPIEIEVNGYKTKIAVIDEWQDYNMQTKQLQANLVDKLNYLDTNFAGILLSKNKTAYEILQNICVPSLFSQIEFDNAMQNIIVTGYGSNKAEKTIKAHLESIEIQYAYLEGSTVRDALKKVLTIATLVLFTTASGAFLFGCGRPRITENEASNPTIIQPNGQNGDYQEILQPKNAYGIIEYKERNIIISENIENVKTYSIIVQDDSGSYVADENGEFSIVGINLNGSWTASGNAYLLLNNPLILTNETNQVPDEIDNNLQIKVKKTYSSGSTEEYILPNKTGAVPLTEEYVFYSVLNDEIKLNFNIQVKWDSEFGGLIKKQKVSSFDIIIYKKTYEFVDDIKNSNSKFSIYSTELLQKDTTINNEPIGQYISNCLVEDYSTHNGIRTATMTVTGSIDYSDSNGNKVVVWNGNGGKPTILEKGMTVIPLSAKKYSDGNYIPYSTYKDGSPRLWKITGVQSKLAENNRFVIELMEVFN